MNDITQDEVYDTTYVQKQRGGMGYGMSENRRDHEIRVQELLRGRVRGVRNTDRSTDRGPIYVHDLIDSTHYIVADG